MKNQCKRILVTGTDTNVGKTYVSCKLIEYLKGQNLKVSAFKPVESGVKEQSETDAFKLSQALGSGVDTSMYQLKEPLSPHIAAKKENVEISLEKILNKIDALSSNSDVLLIEGAGGILVPISNDYTFADLAKDANLSVLVVAGSKLGVINHLQLTLEVAKSRSLNTLPYILNEGLFQKYDLAVETNIEALKLCCSKQMLARVLNSSEIEWCLDNPLGFFYSS